MRRLHIVWILVVVSALSVVPTMAQSGTIATVIRNRSDSSMDFTILQEFLDAAPSIRNRLNRAGSYTIFAPDDRAFRNLEGALGLDLSTIIADIDVVTAILDYHIIDTNLSAQTLRQRDGQVIQTRLPNAFIGIRVDDDNMLVVNNVVEIIEPDVTANNGTIHVINDVLLNRVVNTLIDERLRNQVSATPTATPSPTTTPPPTATAPAQIVSSAYIRFANFAPDVLNANMSVGSDFMIETIAYSSISDFMPFAQGIYTVTIDSSDDDMVLDIDLDLTLLNGDFITIALIGSDEKDSLEAIILSDDVTNLDDDESRLMILHAVEDVSTIDIVFDEESLTNGLRFSEFEGVDIDSAQANLALVETRDIDTALVRLEDQVFAGGISYFVAIIDIEDRLDIVIVETNRDDFSQGNQNNASEADAVGLSTQQGSIIEYLDSQDNFTILIEALSVVDEDVLAILNSDDITFLAPNDQAFLNLFSTIGYSQNRFLANEALVTDILLYHILDKTLFSDDLLAISGTSIETRLRPSQAFFVSASNSGTIFLNGSVEIIQMDIDASNGVIHAIDDVLLPQSALDILGL
ncbi:MAG: hypothetical protein Phog2KO_28510 [Phototrophicaceae bacterium]